MLKLFSSWPLQCCITLLSGILMGMAPAPFNAWFFAWVAVVPLWVLVNQGPQRSWRWGVALAFCWGLGYHGLALSWILDLHPLTWMGIPWLASVAIAIFAWVFITLWGAAIPVVWSLSLFWINRSAAAKTAKFNLPAVRIVLSTAVWCGLEQLWEHGPLYWTSISYTQSPFNLPILHLGQLSGPMTVTAALLLVNGCLAEAILAWLQRDSGKLLQQYSTAAIALLIGFHTLGWALYAQPLNDDPNQALTVGIVQGNVPTRIKLSEQGYQLAIANYVRGYNTLANQGVDVVITPEGSLPWRWVNTPTQSQNPLYQAILQRGVPAWVGTFGTRNGRYTQTLFTITGDGEIYSQFDKIKLVPLGEYIPFEAVLGQVISRLSTMGDSMLPGSPDQRFDTPFGRAIAAICYESPFASLFRNQAAAGGEFILTASNNDPYKRPMMAQHHAQDVMRSVETSRYAVRATNTGLSGVVNPHGRTLWLSNYREFQTYAATIYRRQIQTLYVRWGNWFTPVLLLVGMLMWIGRRPQFQPNKRQ
ncbi:apolipoprotein N-acyltransferase [Leptolyngbya sp. AN02str]|uniref:apolipoprotein N-acyltransferase n=1 Tax=Leptolyngbya sp. AN02str TaxID=3423363 RepID=UPI003D31DCC7